MAVNKHIIHIHESWTNVKANLGGNQTAILSDEHNQLVHKEGADFFFPAYSKYWDGAVWQYLDEEFNAVVALSVVDVADALRHYGDTDTGIAFLTDRVKILAGGIEFVNIEETTQNIIEINPDEGDIDFTVNANSISAALHVEGSTGNVSVQRHLAIDSDAHYAVFGENQDVGIRYNGAVMEIDSSLLAPTDINITCGANKTFELQNVVYDDLQVTVSLAKLPASNAPTWRTYNYGIVGGVALAALGFGINDYIDFFVQTTHSMKLNTILNNHIHWTIPSDSSGNRIKFQLDVVAAGIGDAFAVPSGSPFSNEYLLTATESGYHKLLDVADIPSANTTVSSVYICRLKRVSASSNDYAQEVYISFDDCHYQKNTIGSRFETAK